MIATILRDDTGRTGTHGRLFMAGFRCVTLERRWRGNLRDISCIPAGEYRCEPIVSPRFGETFQIVGVPDRSEIILHWGNWAGEGGARCDSRGCPLLGEKRFPVNGQDGITNSRKTMARFVAHAGRAAFDLLIVDDWEEG